MNKVTDQTRFLLAIAVTISKGCFFFFLFYKICSILARNSPQFCNKHFCHSSDLSWYRAERLHVFSSFKQQQGCR